MKCFLLFILCGFSFYLGNSQVENSDKYIIKGSYIGHNSKVIKITYLDKNHVWIDDTAKINNGNFGFRGVIAEPTLVTIYGNIESRSVDVPNFTELFIEPDITVINLTENNFKDAVVEGSKSQALFDELRLLKRPVEESSESIGKTYSLVKDAYTKGDTSKMTVNRMEDLRLQLIPFQDKIRDIDLKFIKNHKNE